MWKGYHENLYANKFNTYTKLTSSLKKTHKIMTQEETKSKLNL